VNALVYSSSLAAAFLGGILALFAPCCIVSVLPTFVGAAVERGRLRLPLTAAIFAGGIATVMLPIVLGIGLLSQVLASHHREVFFGVGLFLVLLALQVLSGRPWTLPVPMLRLRVSGSTPAGIYALGVVSGFASSCCAPVLAGVAVMSALAGSALGALALGFAYVLGMVFPLLLAVLFWDKFQLGLRMGGLPRLRRLRAGSRELPWADVMAGAMFLVIGTLALYIAYTGQSTYLPDWLTGWNRWATGVAGNLAAAFRGVPIWLQAVILTGLAIALGGALYASWVADSGPGVQTRPSAVKKILLESEGRDDRGQGDRANKTDLGKDGGRL
jgi:cytochrome c-type biogenesis protein